MELKTVIITGANSGLGYETARKIAQNKDYRVILACKNDLKAEDAKKKIIDDTGNENVLTMHIDVSSLNSILEFVKEFNDTGYSLYALINNAGISGMNKGITEDGVELVYATNYLGAHALTMELLKSHDIKKIFNVTSDMHNPPFHLKWKKPHKIFFSKKNKKAYSYSKLSLIYFTYELQERLETKGKDTLVNAYNPGMMKTNFMNLNDKQIKIVRKLMPKRCGDLDKSSTALAELVLDDELKLKAKYFDRSTNYINSSKLSYNEANRKELFNFTEEFIRTKTQK